MDPSKESLANIFGEKNKMKIAKGSKWWILISFFTAVILLVFYLIFIREVFSVIILFFSVLVFLKSGFFLLFFRDPDRKVGQEIVSVADGKIREIKKTSDEDVGDCIFISTFMNVYNVHVNRMPIDGTVKDVVHISGSHIPAFKKESERNERVILKLETAIGMVKVIQIAGTLARRIVPYVKKGDKLKKGDRIGIIRLGSRLDIYLPSKKVKHLTVKTNDRIKAGESTIAEIND